MDEVRQVASAALSLRKARGLRVRLPLARLTVAAADAAALQPFADILRDEVNVKDVVLTDDVAALRPVRGRGQRPCLRAAAGRRHPEGDPRGQGGGVDGEPGRHRRGGRHHAAAGRVHREAGGGRPVRERRRCPATPAWSCWTRR